MMTPSDIVAKVRRKRVNLGLSQGELGKKAGVTLGTVWNIENGRGHNVLILLAVLDVLDIKLELK